MYEQKWQINTICGDFVCILLFPFLYKNYLSVRRFLVLFFFFLTVNPRISRQRSHSTTRAPGPGWMRLLAAPRSRGSPRRCPPAAAALPGAALGQGEPCRAPRRLAASTEPAPGSQHLSRLNYHPDAETPHLRNEYTAI